ncbi:MULTISPECIES: pilus assembly FimT family protein [unclassified Variovorax]|jgi:type IV fimbrial biogenesis protein FimT|uniref:pilus assembly FimT family protein n=1 Tax=unclassified Variovorax TaxID=663243 RepID=UPI000D119A3F|nr:MULTISPECIES: prepilin-type N-terminal cleavage/methylation domain-containing protein [unclassified Variovorax]AVQ83018.1 type II secretion system protein GspH [Variovorax sp. PMC12]QRY32692.1 prepilin-type N-terminal cleavage/methylation domain-containing protein [Variovorax sp. PDNC026]
MPLVMTGRRHPARHKGFTLVEMIVVVAIMALLAALATPSMLGWVRNNKIRTVSDALQNGLRQAQTEATRRSRQVVFSLTDGSPTNTSYTAKANGSNWAISTVVPADSDATAAFVEAGILRDVGSNVAISGPISICFSSIGRLVANDTPGPTSAKCTAAAVQYDIAMSDSKTGDRPLRVLVALGGQVRMCDPARTLSDTQPDGCP